MWPQRHTQEHQVETDETPSVRELRNLLRTSPMDALRGLDPLAVDAQPGAFRSRHDPDRHDDIVKGRAEGGFST